MSCKPYVRHRFCPLLLESQVTRGWPQRGTKGTRSRPLCFLCFFVAIAFKIAMCGDESFSLPLFYSLVLMPALKQTAMTVSSSFNYAVSSADSEIRTLNVFLTVPNPFNAPSL